MPNKTYIPAFSASVGDWSYYICKMKYAEVARSVGFAHELGGGNKDLSTLIQRGLTDRTLDIKRYLLESKTRFLGSLIIAAWGGMPGYTPLAMDESNELLSGLDEGFGLLTFDGTHSFFALDGQHRLKAIKDAVAQEPDMGSEDICVLLVTHQDTPLGRERTQRLFTNINRNAKTTTHAENIALDVDDAYAIITRRLLTEHQFLSETQRVKVFTRPPTPDGVVKLAAKHISKTDTSAWTSMTTLYEIVKSLSFDAPRSVTDRTMRPTDEVLKDTYKNVTQRIDDLLLACGDIRKCFESVSAKELRIPAKEGGQGHPMMRPLIQQAVTRVTTELVKEGRLNWKTALERLRGMSWQLEAAPWISVFNVPRGRMITGKDHSELLADLLRVHLQPNTVADIRRARRAFKDLIGEAYPVAEESLTSTLDPSPQS